MNADEVTRLLDEMQGRLEGPAAYVFELAVRQVYISSIVIIVGGLIIIALAVVGVWRAWRWYGAWEQPENRYSSNDRDIPAGIFTLLALLVCLFAGLLIGSAIIDLANPEYAALSDIMDKVSG